MVGTWVEFVETGAHIERCKIPAAKHKIDRGAAGMGGAFGGVGEEIRVRRVGPEFPLRFGRAERVVNQKAVALRFGEGYGAGECVGSVGMEKTARIFAVDGLAGEVIGRRVFQVDPHIVGLGVISMSIAFSFCHTSPVIRRCKLRQAFHATRLHGEHY